MQGKEWQKNAQKTIFIFKYFYCEYLYCGLNENACKMLTIK